MAYKLRKDVPILQDSDFDHSYTSKFLGYGAYGRVETVVYLGSICAAKYIHSMLVNEVSQQEKDKVIEDFLHECERCKNITHSNVVKFYGVYYPPEYSHGDIPVMVMELMHTSLSAYILKEKGIGLGIKRSLLFDVATGLSYLHSQSMIHRDLSPKNILLNFNTSKGTCIAKIADLGVAKVVQADSKLVYTKAPGTPVFMPPEALTECPHYTTLLDVFSYGGVVLFVAIHEWPIPLDHKGLSEVERRRRFLNKMNGGMEVLRALVEVCLSNDPSKRPTMKAVLKSLSEVSSAQFL